MGKSEEKYCEARLKMESAISEFYKASQECGATDAADEICDKVFDATNGAVKLCEE